MSLTHIEHNASTFSIESDDNIAKQLRNLDNMAQIPAIIACKHAKGQHDWTSLIHIAEKSKEHRNLLIDLVIRGYHLYKSDDHGSLFAHQSQINLVWDKVINNDYIFSQERLVYQLSQPVNNIRKPTKLLVVFSQVNENRYTQFLNRHFAPSFKKIQKYVHDDTLILRIADLGGVVGSFYLPTRYDPNNSDKVIRLIRSIIEEYRILDERVVLCGISKGATGALFTSLRTGWRCVAVDPIVSKRTEGKNDPYYAASRIFLGEREQLFLSHAETPVLPVSTDAHITLITSPRSAEYSAVYRIGAECRLRCRTQLIVSHNPLIEMHAYVARHTIPITLSTINGYLAGFAYNPGVYHLS